MSDQNDAGPPAGGRAADRAHTGTERRDPSVPDRRATRRGGRRATDALKRVARFVHDLLTEPPR